MSEEWSGVIDNIVDGLSPTSQTYGYLVLSGARRADAADDDDKERVIIRDSDRIPLVHVGQFVHLVLERNHRNRAGVRTFRVLRCITTRAAAQLTRAVMSRALCNPIALVRARADLQRARAASSQTAGLRDAPLGPEATKLVTKLVDRPAIELSALVSDRTMFGAALVTAFSGFFAFRGLFVESDLGRLFAALKTRPLNLAASMIGTCSTSAIRALVSRVESMSALAMLFGVTYAPVSFQLASLSEPLRLADASVCAPGLQSLPPTTLAEFRRATTGAQHLRDLLRECTRRDITEAELAEALETHVAVRAFDYGSTVFSHTEAPTLVALGIWVRVADQAYALRHGLAMYSTPDCLGRAEQLAGLLRAFTTVTTHHVAGGCKLLNERDIVETGLSIVPNDNVEISYGLTRVLFSLRELIAADEVSLRTAAHAPTLVLLDAHLFSDHDMLLALLAARRLFATAPTKGRHDLVLIGDRHKRPLGRAAGSPFADIVRSRLFCDDDELASTRQIDCHPLASLASGAHHSLASGDLCVDALLACRRRTWADVAVALREGFQLVVWVTSVALLGAYLTAAVAALRNSRKHGRDDDDDSEPGDSVIIAGLDRLRAYPHMARDHVLTSLPYVLLNGVTLKVLGFYRLWSWPDRQRGASESDLQVVTAPNGLISLDMASLVLHVENDHADHRLCCKLHTRQHLRVSQHRHCLQAASVMLGRTAAAATHLATSVAFALLGNSTHTAPLTNGARWNETICGLVNLPHRTPRSQQARVRLLAHETAGSDEAVAAALADMCRLRGKARTALDYKLKGE